MPALIPDTVPPITAAIPGMDELQKPPETDGVKVIEELAHTEDTPRILPATVIGFTVTVVEVASVPQALV